MRSTFRIVAALVVLATLGVVPVHSQESGLDAEYFDWSAPQGRPRLRVDAAPALASLDDPALAGMSPSRLGARWSGLIAGGPGELPFSLDVTGGRARIWLDETLIWDECPSALTDTHTVTVRLDSPRPRRLRVEFQSISDRPGFRLAAPAGAEVQFLREGQPRFTLPATSAVSPAFVQGRFPDGLAVRVDGVPIEARALDESLYAFEVPLDPRRPIPVLALSGNAETQTAITWKPTRLEATDFVAVRRGDSLLLAVARPGLIVIDGPGGSQQLEAAERAVPFRFDRAGTHTVGRVGVTGEVQTRTVVEVAEVDLGRRILAQVGATRQVEIPAVGSSVVLTGNSLVSVGATRVEGGTATASLAVVRRGTPLLIARLGGPDGPILASAPIEEFSLHVPGVAGIAADGALGTARTHLFLEPAVPDLRLKLGTLSTEARFENGLESTTLRTPPAGATEGRERLDLDVPLRVPPGEFHACWEMELHDERTEEEVPVCVPPWGPGNVCHVLGYRTLIFSRADDEKEDEVLPKADDEADTVRRCRSLPLPQSDNPELWTTRLWPTLTRELTGGDARVPPRYRVTVSGPEPLTTRLDNPLAALYGGATTSSECQDCDGACGPVAPDMDSGTIPGLYTTMPESCDGQGDGSGDGGGGGGTKEASEGEESAPAGSFLVSKLDAHGIESGTTDKFPDYAVVLPKRAGTVTAPLIQMDSGGDRSVAGCCSLYGTVCPQANVWEFTAVAIHPLTGTATGQHVAAGYRLVWRNIPFDVIETENGQPVRIRSTLPAGRHFPLLEVYGPDSFTGQGDSLVGSAAIHSIAVENRPTDNVGEKNPDVARPAGTAFHVTNHIGATQVPVDARIGITRVDHPHPDFVVGGRVSLDGHPQDQYRVGKDDVDDLPQVVTVPGDAPQTYYLQGYQAASLKRDDLKLRVAGQAQVEACASTLFFLDKTPCDRPPSGFPVTVSWMEADIEPFNSSYPIQFQLDEPELKHLEGIDEPIMVAADNVAEDPLQPGDDDGYYIDHGYKGRINFRASVDWDWGEVDGAYFTKVPDDQALTIDWHYAALEHASGRPNFNGKPRLKDLRRRTQEPDPAGRITAILGALTSEVQLDFTKDEGGELRARAGDRFCVAPHSGLADSAMGKSFWASHTVEVEPGDKNFHIVAPNKPADPAQAAAAAALRRDPDQVFDQHTISSFVASDYKDWKWDVPLGPDQRDTLEILALDGSLNAVGDGRRVIWSLEGGGALGSLNADSQPSPQENHADELTTDTFGGGWARIAFRQEHYGTCPWQFQQRPEQSTIYASIDGVSDAATYADVTLDDALPSPYPPLQLAISMVPAGQADPADARIALLDIARGERADVTATLTRGGRPLGGVPIAFTVNNGTLDGASVRTTNDAGEARVFVSGRGADLSPSGFGEILISAQISSLRASLDSRAPPGAGTVTTRSLPRWRSSARPIVTLQDPVLVSDAFGARSVRKEALSDEGELSSPRVAGLGGVEGDEYVVYPIFDTTRVVVRGEPNHRYRVGVFGPSGLAVTSTGGPSGAAARYPFDTLTTQGVTPDVLGPNDADVETPVVLSPDARIGIGALLFGGTGRALVPASAPTDARGGVRIALWARPTQAQDSTVLFAPGQFRLVLRPDGRLRLTAFSGPTATASVDSDVPLPNGRWSYVELRLSESLAFLTVGPDPATLDTVASTTAPGVFGAPTGPVEVGSGFTGSLDELSFAKGGFAPQQANLIGLGPGNTFTTGPDGTFTFSFGLTSRPAQGYLPETYQIVVFGTGQGSATVRAMPKDVWGGLLNVGRAFLFGEESLGKDAAWYERAAAWASTVLPIVSDGRTLALEIYKAATGCDTVSWMNVTFATAGLVLDVVSFGTAGTALRVTRSALATVVKRFLRETLNNVAGDLLFKGAAEAFSRLVTVEVLQVDGKTTSQLRPWVLSAQEYLTSLTTLVSGAYKDYLGKAFRSADDLFVGLMVFQAFGAAEFAATFAIFDDTFPKLNDTAGLAGAGLVETAAGGGLSNPGNLIADLIGRTALEAPRPPRKRLPSEAKVLNETFRLIGNKRIISRLAGDPEALAGLKKMVNLVVKSSRDGEGVKRLAVRLQRSLDMFTPGEVKLLLKDFNTVHDAVKNTNLEDKLQALARDIAARGSNRTVKSRRALRSRVKGAVYALQEAEAAIRRNTLKRAADGIEPPSAIDNRLFRDLTEILGNRPHYIELKAVEQLSGTAVGHQLHRHFERVSMVSDVNALTPLVVRSINAVSEATRRTIREQAVAGIMLRNGFPKSMRPQVTKWANDNIKFDVSSLLYTPR